VLNWLALTGWGATQSPTTAALQRGQSSIKKAKQPPSSTDIFDLQELIKNFDITALTNRRTILDSSKLDILNRRHLQREASTTDGLMELSKRALELIKRQFPYAKTDGLIVRDVFPLLEDRLVNLNELPSLISFLFQEPVYDSAESRTMKSSLPPDIYAKVVSATIAILNEQEISESEWPETAVRALLDPIRERFRKDKVTMSVLRHALTGEKIGLSVTTMMALLGRDRTLKRLQDAKRAADLGDHGRELPIVEIDSVQP